MGNLKVKTQSLKRQFSNPYFEFPVNAFQVLSNSFILKIAERMKFSKTLWECELCCWKEHSKRVTLLLGIAKSSTLLHGSFEQLCQEVINAGHILMTNRGREQIPSKKQVLAFVWVMPNQELSRSVADRRIGTKLYYVDLHAMAPSTGKMLTVITRIFPRQ